MNSSSKVFFAFLLLLFAVSFGCLSNTNQPTPSKSPTLTPAVSVQPSVSAVPSGTPSTRPTVLPAPTFTARPSLDPAKYKGADMIAAANNQFAFALYSKLSKPGENLFFSPFSISSAMAVVYEGARGQTSQEIQKVFRFPADDFTRRLAYSQLFNDINAGDGVNTLEIANALWVEKTFSLLPQFMDLANETYSAKASNLDFNNSAENSRQAINQWTEEKTRNLIKDLLPQGSVKSATRLVVTNAIYMNASWLSPFEKEATQDDEFTTASGRTVNAKMMQQTDDFLYAENDDLQAVLLPYSGGKLSLMVFLPKSNASDPFDFIGSESLTALRNSLSREKVNVILPKVRLEQDFGLKEQLEGLGMPVSFSDDADFSGLSGKPDLKISDVIHKTFLDVTEAGTEAAAATAVIMVETTAINPATPKPPIIFRADHPYGFVILQEGSSNILFMGKVADPSAS